MVKTVGCELCGVSVEVSAHTHRVYCRACRDKVYANNPALAASYRYRHPEEGLAYKRDIMVVTDAELQDISSLTLEEQELEKQRRVTKQAYRTLRGHMKRLGVKGWFACASGNAEVLRGDSLAWEALRVYRQEHSRLCRLRHPELKAYSHNWYEVHREKYLAWSRSSYYSHPEKYIAWSRGWARSHPEQSSEIATKYRRHRRALLAGASGSFTSTEFGALCEESGDRCTYCGRSKEEVGELVPDHMTPLTRGGSDSIDNITPACTEDNGSKGNKTVPEYLEYLEHLVNRAEVRFSGEHNSKV